MYPPRRVLIALFQQLPRRRRGWWLARTIASLGLGIMLAIWMVARVAFGPPGPHPVTWGLVAGLIIYAAALGYFCVEALAMHKHMARQFSCMETGEIRVLLCATNLRKGTRKANCTAPRRRL